MRNLRNFLRAARLYFDPRFRRRAWREWRRECEQPWPPR